MSKTHNDISYYFAYWKHDEAKWSLSLKRFLLSYNNVTKSLTGQFITSMWLKYVISQEKPMHYIVFGVKNMAHRHNVLDEINRKHTGEMRNSGRPPTMSDLPETADFCEYFVGSNKITTKINSETNKNIHTIYTFPGVKDRYNRELKMNYEGYDGKLCATLPEFIIKC